MHSCSQQLCNLVPKIQLVAGDLEAGAEEQGASQAQEYLIRQLVPQRAPLLGSQHLSA